MKTKKIKNLLENIINKFIENAFNSSNKKLDDEMKKIFIKHSFITGGCIPSLIMDDYVNDIDIYINEPSLAYEITNYFIKIAEEKNIKKIIEGEYCTYHYEDENKYLVNFKSPNSINFNGNPKIQIISKYAGLPEEIIDKFDFLHIKSYYVIYTKELHFVKNVHETLFNKEIIYTGSDYPLSSMIRVNKLIKKGWSIEPYYNLLIALDLQKYDLTNKNVIINQLTGIDPLYINSKLNALINDKLNINERINDIIDVFKENETQFYF
jgi:hypothetical protein